MAKAKSKTKLNRGSSWRTESGDFIYPNNTGKASMFVRDSLLSFGKKVLAIDLGMKYGYAYLNKDQVVCGYSDVSATRFATQFAGLRQFQTHMMKIIDVIGPLDAILFEEVAMHAKSVYSLQVNAWLLGALEAVAIRAKCYTVKGFKPAVIKGYATGKGNSKKDKMIIAANKMYGLSLNPDFDEHGNTADALHLLSLGCEALFNMPPLHESIKNIISEDLA